MTKIEKYFKDDITPNEAYDLLFEFTGYISLLPMNNQDDRVNLYNKVMEFLNQEVKPTLTEDETVILKNLPTKYEFIGRNYSGILQLSEISKFKTDCYCWDDIDELFNHLFQFIQPRRRI